MLGGRSIRNALFAAIAMAAIMQTGLAETLAPADAKALETRAKIASEVFRAKNYDALLDMTHPAVFQLVGGKEQLLEAMKAAMSQMDKMKFTILDDQFGTPGEVYASGEEMVCFYPRTMVMQIDDKKIKSTGFLICARKRAGGEWLFMDGDNFKQNPSLLEKLLPGLPKDLKLPESKAEPIE